MNAFVVENAVIVSADIDRERVRLNYWVHLQFANGSAQAFGGYVLGGDFGCEAIARLLEVVGVERWSQLSGRAVRARLTLARVHAIGHFMEDRWLDLEALAKELGLRKEGGAS